MATGKLILTMIIKWFFVIFYGVVGSIGVLFDLIRKGPRRFFHRTIRESRPGCMNDPGLGEHGYLSLKEANIRIHYVAAGDKGKPLMLFVHGFPECWFVWRHQMKAFKNDYRVVAIDLRGYGESECPNDVLKYTHKILIDDVKEVISELGYSSCVLVAHDWGGVIAWNVAMVYPDLVDKLIVCNAAYPDRLRQHLYSHLSQFRKSWYIFFFQIPYISEMMLTANDFGFLDTCFTGEAGTTAANICSPDELEAMKFSFSQKGTVTAALNYYRAAAKTKPIISKQVTCPTIVIWGKHDDVLEVAMAEGTEKYVDNFRLKVVENASHWVQQECPDEVNRLINQFLQE